MGNNVRTLNIVTDLDNTGWLSYLLEEFRRINKSDFEIRVTTTQNQGRETGPEIIYYTRQYAHGVSLVNKADVLPRGSTRFLSGELFITEDTTTDDPRFALPYDLFWNAFIFLSRLEEYQAEKNGRPLRSYSSRHPRQDKTTFAIPIVNLLFNELEQIIRQSFPSLSFGEKDKPVTELSHDLDYVTKTPQLRIKQTVFNGVNALRRLPQLRSFKAQLKKTIGFAVSNPSYWCFDYWTELETQAGRRSVFYVYAKAARKNFTSWLLDPSYDISRHPSLTAKLKELVEKGFEIGLHGSYDSAGDERLLEREKELLENTLHMPITRIRQHWLNYRETITPYLHEKLFANDSTLGWNDRTGFRSGCLSRYHPFDHKNQRPFSHIETPQVIMDSHIFDYQPAPTSQMIEDCQRLIENLANYKSAHIAISWHNRVCNPDYGWEGAYTRILNVI